MNILYIFMLPINTGYAIEKLEKIFIAASRKAYGKEVKIHFSFTKAPEDEASLYSQENDISVFEFDVFTKQTDKIQSLVSYIKKHNIQTVVGFDTPPNAPYLKAIRSVGVKNVFAYMGAPASSINKGLKLLVKKGINKFHVHQPDVYIFESIEMARTAYEGRGIPKERVRICNLGVDTEKYKYLIENQYYAHEQFSLDKSTKIFYYSGHMERRKGVHVLLDAVNLLKQQSIDGFHLLIFGNKDEAEIAHFRDFISENNLESLVTFGGYRDDLEKILSSIYTGLIASTGWDSFTMSSVEIMSSSVPLVTSSLQGLKEITLPGETGFQFVPGNATELSQIMKFLLLNSDARDYLANNARRRVEENFSKEIQIENLSKLLLE